MHEANVLILPRSISEPLHQKSNSLSVGQRKTLLVQKCKESFLIKLSSVPQHFMVRGPISEII